jgi:hypothetical protein
MYWHELSMAAADLRAPVARACRHLRNLALHLVALRRVDSGAGAIMRQSWSLPSFPFFLPFSLFPLFPQLRTLRMSHSGAP